MTAGPGRYAFLRTRRWVGVVVVGVLVAAACVLLGRWQWSRHVQRVEFAATVDANIAAAVVPLRDLLADAGGSLDPDDEWRPARVRGTYVAGSAILRSRPVDGQPAVHVLAPMAVTMPDGEQAVLVVDRGWLPAGAEETPGAVPASPAGEVTAVVRLRPVEEQGRDGPPGQVYRVHPPSVLAASGAADLDLPLLEVYGVLAAEDPAPAVAPTPLPPPSTSLRSHLSYAVQWWLFALGALVGVVVLARREAAALAGGGLDARGPSGSGPGGSGPGDSESGDSESGGPAGRDGPAGSQAPAGVTSPATATPVRRRRRPSAEDEEDALIDVQLRGRP